jgi:mono/diheme cytochrome c family protein
MSKTLLIGYYFAAAAVAAFIILWIIRKPGEDDSEETTDLSVSLPYFHHTGAYLSAGFVVVTLAFYFFTNYTMGTDRQWWLIDMFDSSMVKAYEAPMASPADGTVSDRYVQNYNRYLPEANELTAPEGADLAQGERMYNTYCAPCHAVEGKGFGPVAKRSGTIPGIALSGSSGKSEATSTSPSAMAVPLCPLTAGPWTTPKCGMSSPICAASFPPPFSRSRSKS